MRETHRQSTLSVRRAAEARQDGMAPEAEGMGDQAPGWLVVAQSRAHCLLRNRRQLAALSSRHLHRGPGDVPAHLWHRAGRDRLSLAASGRDEGRADRRRICGDAEVRRACLGMRVCVVWYKAPTSCEGRSHEVSILRASTPPTRRQEFPGHPPGPVHLRASGSALLLSRLGALAGTGPRMAAGNADGAGPGRSRVRGEHEDALRSRRLSP
jgi:hypothetical protein